MRAIAAFCYQPFYDLTCVQLLGPDQIRFLDLQARGKSDEPECRALEELLDADKHDVGMAELHILGLVELVNDCWVIEPRGKACLEALGFDVE